MTWLIVALVAVGVVAAIAALGAHRRSRRAALERRFGPEYDRAVAAHGGDRRRAEASLRAVAKRRDALDVRQLERPERARYAERWRQTQLGFVDEPAGAVRQADALVHEVLRERGYAPDGGAEAAVDAGAPAEALAGPRADVDAGSRARPDAPTAGSVGGGDREDDRLALVAADHPQLVADYRSARPAGQVDGAGVDALREAFLRARALFDRLVEGPEDAAAGSPDAGDYGSVAGERRAPPG
ncbi:MAG TPA: hypothetical protein VIL48_22875 [Acidimicrobiales bacterium]